MAAKRKFKAMPPEAEAYQALLSELFALERQTSERGCTQIIEEAYDEGTFLYQSLSRLRERQQLTGRMLSRPSSEPYISLAAFLSILDKKISPDIPFLLHLAATQSPDQILRFCISGEISLDKLRRLIEHQKECLDSPHKT